jgi:biotin carboxylase
VPPYYDSMIGKLIVRGDDRAEALARAARALREFECSGVATTLDFHRLLIEDEAFSSGAIHTRWVENSLLPRMLEEQGA